MPFYFTCPYCFKKTLVDDSLAGQQGACANCAKQITIPEPPAKPQAGTKPVGGKYLSSQPRSPMFAIWAVKLVGLVLCLGLVVSVAVFMLKPIYVVMKQRRDRTACMNNLQRIAMALNSYADRYGSYPPPVVYDSAGKPMHSWRVLILPELDEESLYSQYNFDEPWDSVNNARLFASCPKVYTSPGAGSGTIFQHSSYVLVTGDKTIFPKAGPLARGDISDPLDSTLLVVETENANLEWTNPIDLDRSKMNTRIGGAGGQAIIPTSIGGNHAGGATVVFADGTPGFLPADLPPALLEAMITPNGGEPVNPSDYHLPY